MGGIRNEKRMTRSAFIVQRYEIIVNRELWFVIYFVILQPDMRRILTIMLLTIGAVTVMAQDSQDVEAADADSPTFVPTVRPRRLFRLPFFRQYSTTAG